MILSAFSPAELASIIATDNDKMLSTVKGLGKKTSQKIIVELKDKVDNILIDTTGTSTSTAPINTEVYDEATNALKLLGFNAGSVVKVVKQILQDTPDASVETVIKQALKLL